MIRQGENSFLHLQLRAALDVRHRGQVPAVIRHLQPEKSPQVDWQICTNQISLLNFQQR